MRHATAEDDAASDFERRLTDHGRREMGPLLDGVVASGWRPAVILHSPLVRTRETAAMAAERWPGVPTLACDALADGHLDAIVHLAAQHPDPLLVGHEPTTGRLCARLVGAPNGAMPFPRAGFALLDVDRLPTTRPAVLLAFLSPRFSGRGATPG
jgi:phosphohistidine phosphatase